MSPFEIVADDQTRLSWVPGGSMVPVEIGQHVSGPIRFERVTEENFLYGWSKPIRITLRGHSDRLSPLAYRLLLGCRHPRISRMRAAYGRRRKGW